MKESIIYARDSRDYFEGLRRAVDAELAALLDGARVAGDEVLQQAMRYTVLSGGKRIRPLLTLAAADLFAARQRAMKAACAIELIHSASLILDDLPCMDNAGLRRGQAANHLVFGEDIAILSAVNMLALAFGVLADYGNIEGAPPELGFQLLRSASRTVGADGLVGGQLADLHGAPARTGFGILEAVYERKTVRLFMLAAEAGAAIGHASPAEAEALLLYARHFGLAFQILDDVLDAKGDPALLGKDVFQDAAKTTFLKVAGSEGANTCIADLVRFAVERLAIFGQRASMLAGLPQLVMQVVPKPLMPAT